MRAYELFELVKTKTKTKVKTSIDIKLDDPTSKGELTTPSSDVKSPSISKKLPGKKRTKAQTVSDVSQMDMPQGAGEVMSDFLSKTADITDEIPDDDIVAYSAFDNDPELGQSTPVEPTTLPATVSKELSAEGFQLDISWHEIRNLPGYALQQIRGAFRPLFRDMMNAELEDVSVSTTLDPQTSMDDIKSLIGFIGRHGIKEDNFQLEAFDIDPKQYNIKNAYIYDLNNFRFLLLEEELDGQINYYVYSSAGRGTSLGSNDQPAQIS